MNAFDLSGRQCLVTGASSGIGRSIAVLLSRCGARVLGVARSEERLRETVEMLSGEGHGYETCDLGSTANLSLCVREWSARHGRFNGLIHAAGIQTLSPIRFFEPKAFEEMWRVNVGAALELVRGFRHPDVCAGDGSIVFISSASAFKGEGAMCGYAATKGALISAARALAVELARHRIRVNCIAPGLVQSEMTDGIMRSIGEARFRELEKQHPLGIGEPEDVAAAVCFLVSDAAKWVTGATFAVDGGFTAR